MSEYTPHQEPSASPQSNGLSPVQRRRIEVKGIVQGVGFRPFVYNLATQLGLAGFVGNDNHGVFIELEGPEAALDHFYQQLTLAPPPLAWIEAVETTAIPVQGTLQFSIVQSQSLPHAHTLVSPDLAICSDCLHELFDPADRRYRYPFINCTNCGPRFTITQDAPYDRPLTTMAGFVMCPQCQAEYADPRNRRFHAQPNACPTCGPQVRFLRPHQWLEEKPPVNLPTPGACTGDAAIQAAQQVINTGGIIAVKGLGGFHLACAAFNDQAVQTLRQRKGRVDKPFAVMAWDVATVRTFAEVTAAEAARLESRERPIVLLRKRSDCDLSNFVAPGNQFIGVMLPYTPLHYLLLQRSGEEGNASKSKHQKAKILVMTSGNLSDEPIVKDNAEAIEKLAPLADAFLLHDRPIHVRCDDSVIRVLDRHEYPIRRSRGYAPFPVKLPFTVQPILAVGGELKSTFCLCNGEHAFMSQHIGDMGNLETVQAFEEAVEHFQRIFRVQPTLFVGDRHPGYLSAQWAQQRAKHAHYVQVQHHHAHIAAVMAEHGLDGHEPVIGFSFDGTGYGLDGAIWGGEVLIADYHGFRRVAHLKYAPLPGGDASIKRPYRMALAQLWMAGVEWRETLPPVAACTPTERKVLQQQFTTGFNTVPTSSMGRLFDAVAALAGIQQTITYEGQAAIELEALAFDEVDGGYHFALIEGEPLQIDPASVIRAVVNDVLAGALPAVVAARFQQAVCDVILQMALRLRQHEKIQTIALSGGVFQNLKLLKQTMAALQANAFHVLVHRLVPPNDGGLALGQAVIGHFL
ncbi:MAG: carbamoyltransferase HypF [Caldilineaceae bacterium]